MGEDGAVDFNLEWEVNSLAVKVILGQRDVGENWGGGGGGGGGG